MNILKPISFCSFKTELPKFTFSLGANTASVTIKAMQNRITVSKSCNQTVIRRSGNYRPPTWDFDFILSLDSEYTGERYVMRASELKMQVKMMLDKPMEPLDQLELIDNIQRLGISYHFENEIVQILTNINRNYSKTDNKTMIKELYATALEFRLLRQHGFNVSQGIFDYFKNEKGDFKPALCNDTKGLLQLYEASFLSTDTETTLEMAREFAIKNLEYHQAVDQYSSMLVQHALKYPLHLTVPRAEAKWFIDAYEKKPAMHPILLEFAVIDFNIVQAKYQDELKLLSRWWKKTCLAQELSFARDRLVECFFWTTGIVSEPQYGFGRTILTKVIVLITIIDDIYDIYGTLEELEIFTCAIERWDVNSIDQLPYYMQICYLALNNFVNEMAYDVLKEKGLIIIPCLRKVWTDLCKAYLQEAKWYFSGYKPNLEEYMNTAWISVGTHVMLFNAFFSVTNPIEEEAVQYMQSYPDLICKLSNIDELKRGDVLKSIQCYMNENGASEDEARKHIKILIHKTWKKMNEVPHTNRRILSKPFIEIATNVGRMAQYMYEHGDGHGITNLETKDRIVELLFEPIPWT